MSAVRWLIYNNGEGLFWHDQDDPRCEGFGGWGHPGTASRYTDEQRLEAAYIPGTGSEWIETDSPEVLAWEDPDA